MTGRQWEAFVARENQQLFDAGRALLIRIPTHMHGGIPWQGHKVDFMGALATGQFVALEAKANTGTLTTKQRNLLAHVANMGGIALVYRFLDGQRYLCAVDSQGNMQRKSKATRLTEQETWLDAWQRLKT